MLLMAFKILGNIIKRHESSSIYLFRLKRVTRIAILGDMRLQRPGGRTGSFIVEKNWFLSWKVKRWKKKKKRSTRQRLQQNKNQNEKNRREKSEDEKSGRLKLRVFLLFEARVFDFSLDIFFNRFPDSLFFISFSLSRFLSNEHTNLWL